MLRDGQHFRVAVPPSFPTMVSHAEPPCFEPIRTATIWAERLVRRGESHWLFFTRDDVNALLLESEQLPGQRKEFQREFQRGYASGFGNAVLRFLGP